MSVDPTLSLIAAQQIGPNSRMVVDVANHPEIAQTMNRAVTATELNEKAQQVASVSDSAQSSAIDDETGGNRQPFVPRRRRKPVQEEPPDEPVESSPSSEGPFLGNLLNRKV